MSLRDCPICLESLSPSSTIAVLTCGHCYHRPCLQRLIDTDNDGHCPLCGEKCITQCCFRSISTMACLICRERILEAPTRTMEIVAPGKELIHTECLQLLRHSEPFRIDPDQSCHYKLWGKKTITFQDHHVIYCFNETKQNSALVFCKSQATFAENVAECVLELQKAIVVADPQTVVDNNSAFVSLRKLRILASSCGLPSHHQPKELGNDTALREARLAVFLREGAIGTAIQTLERSESKLASALWRQAAEFLAEVCFPSYANSSFFMMSGDLERLLLHPNVTSSFIDNFVSATFYRSEEPPFIQAGGIGFFVQLMKMHEDASKLQLLGVQFLQRCSPFERRVFSSGGIAVLRRHAKNVHPRRKELQLCARNALAAFGISGDMIHDERIDFCQDLSNYDTLTAYYRQPHFRNF